MPEPQGVQPQPTPVTLRLGAAPAPDGTTYAVLAFGLVTGTVVMFLSPAELKDFAEKMAAHAEKVANRPIVATTLPPGLVAPGRH